MKRRQWGVALLAAWAGLLPRAAMGQAAEGTVTLAPPSSAAVKAVTLDLSREVHLTPAQKRKLLREKIRYVFVLFQENRSFDFYFGSYPGAHGLYSQPPAQTPGFVQPLVDLDGAVTSIRPFRIPGSITNNLGQRVQLYPADTDSVNHSHTAYLQKIGLTDGVTRNDGYALAEEGVTLDAQEHPSRTPTLAQKQMGELVMAHVDCDVAPVMWNYADRFTLFDNFHQTVLSASTPNAIAMIAGQTGETQWVKHPEQSTRAFGSLSGNGVPVVSDGDPFWGSQLDFFGSEQPAKVPSASPQVNLTFASLPLSFLGSAAQTTTSQDTQPQADLTDIEKDIGEIASSGELPTNWGWYQQGYAKEADDPVDAKPHADYIAHHNGPQYFGYISNNPLIAPHLHNLSQAFADIEHGRLPAGGGVFYLRGGYNNIQGLLPQDPNLPKTFAGNDDHPGYADLQISGALLAQEINAIAHSKYWPQSAIVIAYDETDGLYDHVPEVIRNYDSYGDPLDQGPRIPAIVLSPFSAVHAVSHEAAEHSSIIKLINNLFGLEPLADLPEEKEARARGRTLFGQAYLGPADDGVPGIGDLSTAFDNNRLKGIAPPLPPSYAVIAPALYGTLPQYGGEGCHLLHITPTDAAMQNPVPADFNPRPGSSPGVPAQAGWKP